MFLGMTHGEGGLVAFIFALVWVVQFLPRVGDWLGRALGDKGSGA